MNALIYLRVHNENNSMMIYPNEEISMWLVVRRFYQTQYRSLKAYVGTGIWK